MMKTLVLRRRIKRRVYGSWDFWLPSAEQQAADFESKMPKEDPTGWVEHQPREEKHRTYPVVVVSSRARPNPTLPVQSGSFVCFQEMGDRMKVNSRAAEAHLNQKPQGRRRKRATLLRAAWLSIASVANTYELL